MSQKLKSKFKFKTSLVPATSTAVLKERYNRDETVKLISHPAKKSIQNSINNKVLSQEIIISGVHIINEKNNSSQNGLIDATEIANIDGTSLTEEIFNTAEVSKTSISGVDIILEKQPKNIFSEIENYEYLVSESKSLLNESLLS